VCDCNCQLVTNEILDEAIYSGKKRLLRLTEELLRHYIYGYNCNAQGVIDKISLYVDSVERYRRSFLAGEEACLSCNEFQTILEELKTLTSDCDMRLRIDQTVDTSQRDVWVAMNPYCAPKERWQQLALKVCSDLKFNIKIEDKSEKLLCNLLYVVAVHGGKSCEIDYSVKVDMKQCKAEYDILVKDKDCTLTFGEYVNLKKCGISFDTIAKAKDCGIEFSYNNSEGCPDIIYGTRSCPLNQITIDSSSES